MCKYFFNFQTLLDPLPMCLHKCSTLLCCISKVTLHMHEQTIKLFELNDLRMQKAFNKTMD